LLITISFRENSISTPDLVEDVRLNKACLPGVLKVIVLEKRINGREKNKHKKTDLFIRPPFIKLMLTSEPE